MLSDAYPAVALELLNRYFALPDDFDHAQAHVVRARAYTTLGNIENAIAAFEMALQREAAFPQLLTTAYLDLPLLIATAAVSSRYAQALDLLEKHKLRVTFPVDHFLWHTAQALILSAKGNAVVAANHARHAMQSAASKDSGLRYHPDVGLVGVRFDDLLRRLATLSGT